MSDFDKQQLSSRTETDSVASGDNTNGLTVTLDTYGRPFINCEYSVGGPAVVVVEGRYELPGGGYTDWREYTSVDTSNSNVPNDDIIQLPWVSYDEVRVSTDTTGIDVEFIISGTRG